MMLIVIARLGLPEMVGQFALAMAVTTPIILLIGLDLRTVQATDQSNRYPFQDFFTLRLISLALALAVIMGFTCWQGYKQETALLVFVMGVAKCAEALSDLCHGVFQQSERLDQMARARILRGVLTVAVLGAGLYLSRSLLIATGALALLWIGILVGYDWPVAFKLLRRQGQSTSLVRLDWSQLWVLLAAALPTGLLTCQASLEQSLPRLFIDSYLGEHELGIYSAVSSLIMASSMVINAVHSAVLPRMAKHACSRQWADTWRILFRLALLGLVLGGVGTIFVYAFGDWILSMAFGPAYASHSQVLVILLIGSTIRYATLALSTALRAAQRFWLLSTLQTVSLLAATPIMLLSVQSYGSLGAAYSFVVLAVLFAVLQVPAALLVLRSSAIDFRRQSASPDQVEFAAKRAAA